MRYILLAAALSLLSGCGLLSFQVEGDIGEQEVPGDPLGIGGEILGDVFAPIPVTVNVEAALAAQNVKVIKKVFLDAITLNITPTQDADGQDNFDFIQKIDIFASSSQNPDLPRVLVASVENQGGGAKTLLIPGVEGINLKDYIEAGLDVEAEVIGTQPPTDTTFDGLVTVTVQAL